MRLGIFDHRRLQKVLLLFQNRMQNFITHLLMSGTKKSVERLKSYSENESGY